MPALFSVLKSYVFHPQSSAVCLH